MQGQGLGQRRHALCLTVPPPLIDLSDQAGAPSVGVTGRDPCARDAQRALRVLGQELVLAVAGRTGIREGRGRAVKRCEPGTAAPSAATTATRAAG